MVKPFNDCGEVAPCAYQDGDFFSGVVPMYIIYQCGNFLRFHFGGRLRHWMEDDPCFCRFRFGGIRLGISDRSQVPMVLPWENLAEAVVDPVDNFLLGTEICFER